MNLGAFAVVIAVARKTRSGEISSFGGLFKYAPGLAVAMTFFLFSLAGIPPLGGWFAKFVVFRVAARRRRRLGVALAVVVAVNSVIALFYYAAVAKEMWMEPAPDGDVTPIRIPRRCSLTVGAAAALVVLIGVFPRIVLHFSDLTSLRCARGAEQRSPIGLRGLALPVTARSASTRSWKRRSTTPRAASTRAGGRAGRRGDFITSAEVGPLFGAVVARALDAWWDELGSPDPFVVVDAGAGVGTLARAVLAAGPACAAALRYVLVERSRRCAPSTSAGSHSCCPMHAFAAARRSRRRRRSSRRVPFPTVRSSSASSRSRRPGARTSCSPTSCSTTFRRACSSGPADDGRRSASGRRPR